MKMAAYANASVILVGDIDRGGVFASLLGTLELLLPDERKMVKALLINRFRGDLTLLDPLPEMIVTRTGIPVIGWTKVGASSASGRKTNGYFSTSSCGRLRSASPTVP